ncbi:MAG: carboxypeptidase-like regulatory domain-containing protein, partial [Xenococcus sp. MO_188.B8]|nr:carboxypeptidase-like regulatory domain-containing protein [Xenococcus sp. MO_188.B8]
IPFADIALPSTNLIGTITHTSETKAEPIVLAEVRIKGSQDRTLSNSKGEYILSGLEASVRERTVLVRAQGYQPDEGTITLSQPGEQQTLNFELTKPLRGGFGD